MRSENILDDNLLYEVDIELQKGELLLWKGCPKEYFSISMVDMFWRNTNVSISSFIQVVLTISTIIVIKNLNFETSYFLTLLWLSIFWVIAFIPDILKNHRKRKTFYTLTNQRIIIETIKFFRKKIIEIRLSEIGEVNYETYKDGFGIIYLKLFGKTNIKTRDFYSGSKRIYPTLELIPNCLNVYNLIKLELNNKK